VEIPRPGDINFCCSVADGPAYLGIEDGLVGGGGREALVAESLHLGGGGWGALGTGKEGWWTSDWRECFCY